MQQHICLARYMLSPSVCLSGCPSVTWVDQSKTVEIRIMQLTPQSSPILLVLWYKFSPEILMGSPWQGRQTTVE